ncbi:hypothetical protein AAEX63_09855 [Luteococcus sp. H138]|uniref:hypothetical protein n=1 Tax=unclassified Luteococcus TaxID=2639923 RepID=UPI00313D7294
MGTQDPLVHIEAATLAGGDNNQDRYAYGDGWAFVLDGATSFSETPPIHDGGWYAERLKNALAQHLAAADHTTDTASIVAHSIQDAAADHDAATQGPCPTSTIALARWRHNVDLYVLGDSFIQYRGINGDSDELADLRIEAAGNDIRTKYKHRLKEGHGFDATHQAILKDLQAAQQARRNVHEPLGYWIAGADPNAAHHAHTRSLPLGSVQGLLLCTDGIHDYTRREILRDPSDARMNLMEFLVAQHEEEANDRDGAKRPRSKIHDDKTAIWICFGA